MCVNTVLHIYGQKSLGLLPVPYDTEPYETGLFWNFVHAYE
jgi:hypothetical protein